MDEPLQKSLERYDVLDRIAVGGMAEVFLAKAYGAHGFEKTIAIKRILPELARDPEFEARFIAEAKVAVRLSHANVVQVLDFGHIGESLFIAMEFVDGLDLAAFLRKMKDEKRLVPLPAAFHIAIEIMRALDFAHGHNVVHRDVSPSNILISRAGEVKIADFGIAVAAQPHQLGPKGPRRVMGKWRYMSPEQSRGDTLDTRSDMFSAASVIYELFTGEKLFPGDESDEIIKNIDTMVIPKLSQLRPGLPSRLDDVLAGPLARKPIDRPARPAIVLRQLIELSYESSIMATALDVAEALASVIPARRQSGRGALDDVIRKQMHEQSVARQTAVTDGKPPSTETAAGEHSTGLFRLVDPDGIAHLEAEATHVAAPRARRMTGPMAADEPAIAQAPDLDRRTEVGGPPTGQLAKVDEPPPDEPSPAPRLTGAAARAQSARVAKVAPPPTLTPALTAAPKNRAALIALGALGLVAAGGLAVYALTHHEAPPPRAPVVAAPVIVVDAAVPTAPMGSLEVDSVPRGALVSVGGQRQGTSPVTVRVPAGQVAHVKLELEGYSTYEGDYDVKANTIVVIHEKLAAAPAQLVVETLPSGVQVMLDGVALGITPLTIAVPAKAHATIALAKAGFDPIKADTDLVAGRTTTITRELKATQKFGVVTVEVSGTAQWAEVVFKGKSLGRNRVASGLVAHKLPVGRQQLRLTAGNGKTKTVEVDVTERPQTVRITFD